MYRRITTQTIDQYLKIFESIDFASIAIEPIILQNEKNAAYKLHCSAVQSLVLSKEGEINASMIFYASKILLTGYHLKEHKIDAYSLLWRVQELTRNSELKNCLDFSHQKAWQAALIEAWKSLQNSNNYENYDGFSKEKTQANALLFFKHKGQKYELHESGYRLRESSAKKITQDINKKIERVGGLRTLNTMLDTMSTRGRFYDGYILFGRRTGTYNIFHEPNTPWNYIYGLAMRNFDVMPRRKNSQEILTDMSVLARQYSTTFNVETYSSYEYINFEHSSWLAKIYDILLYDELFSLPQWQPHSSTFLFKCFAKELEGLMVSWGPKNQKTSYNITLPFGGEQRWMQLANTISSSSENFIERVSNSTLKLLKESGKECVISTSQINNKFLSPLNTELRTEFSAPFIIDKLGDIYVQPKAVSSRALMEKTFDVLRQEVTRKSGDKRKFDNELGSVLERVTKEVLDKFGLQPTIIGVKYGKGKSTEGEIDLLYETDESIILIECKKKPLSKHSRSGDILSYLGDFKDSFLVSCEQLARFEAKLKKNGSVKFKNGQTVSLGNRKVDKLVINMFDHGSLQSRMVTIPMIKVLYSALFNQTNPQDDNVRNIVEGINDKLKNLVESLNTIHKTLDEKEKSNLLQNFGMSTFWLSIDQLYYLCFKGGDLLKGLDLIRNVTYQSGDLTYEIKQALNLKGPAKEIQEWSKNNNTLLLN